jgi:hypothetical protein
MKSIFNKKLILLSVLAVSVSLLYSFVTADSRGETSSGSLTIENPSEYQSLFAAVVDESAREIVSPTITTEASFNAIAFTWEESQPVDFEMYVRFKDASWTEWQPVEEEVDFRDDVRESNISRLISTPYTNILQYKMVFSLANEVEYVKNLRITHIDATKGRENMYSVANHSSDDLPIISRRQWGANENYQYNESGDLTWEREYYKPEKFILHHTASKDISDPAATVRAIYYWHAVSKGWGDIGYNYLIDQQGNIYEGRSGGDGVVGGHAYMSNRNSIGIAVIGCFDDKHGECSDPTALSPAAQSSINALIAAKSNLFNIQPSESSSFGAHGHVANILGHTDVSSTYCPGNNILAQLGIIKKDAATQLASLPPIEKKTTQAELVSVSHNRIEIPEGESRQVVARFKNTGNATWRGYSDSGVYLGKTSDVRKLGALGSVKLATASSTTLPAGFTLKEGNVAPGDIGTFVMNLPASSTTESYTLAWKNEGYYPNTDFTVQTVKIQKQTSTTTTTSKPSFSPVYKALLERSTLPQRVPANTSKSGDLRFYNIGNTSWNSSQLKLEVTLQNGNPSPLLEKTTFYANESTVSPNTPATFDLSFAAGAQQGIYTHKVVLSHGSNVLLSFNQVVHVISPYSGVVVAQNFPIAVLNTWRPTVSVTIQNVGSETWVNPTLKSTDVDGTLSWFYDWSWADKKTVVTKWQTVEPGEEVTFTFKLKPYWKPNTYPHVYKLWSGSQGIDLNGQAVYERWTRVDG